jgi:hypothetical protein
MTVQELIDQLLLIADRSQQVLDKEYFIINEINTENYPSVVLKP